MDIPRAPDCLIVSWSLFHLDSFQMDCYQCPQAQRCDHVCDQRPVMLTIARPHLQCCCWGLCNRTVDHKEPIEALCESMKRTGVEQNSSDTKHKQWGVLGLYPGTTGALLTARGGSKVPLARVTLKLHNGR